MVDRDEEARKARMSPSADLRGDVVREAGLAPGTDLREDARQAHEARVRRDTAVREADLKAHNQRKEDQVKSNTEAMRRQDEARPTPTQEENDLARIGHSVLQKEDDGSGPDRAALSPEERRRLDDEDEWRRAAEASDVKASYRTRDMAAKPVKVEAPVKPQIEPADAKPAEMKPADVPTKPAASAKT